MATKTLITVDEFDRLIEPDECRYELDEGELIVMTRPRLRHARIVQRISKMLDRYLDRNPVGEVLGSEILFVLKPDTKRAPDIAFLKRERGRSQDPDEEIHGGPDIAIEVISPNDSIIKTRRKIRQFFEAGTFEIWLVLPDTQEVEIWREAKQAARVFTADEALESKDLLPGFSIQVADLFNFD